jgi:Fe-S-cluster containining protein
MTAIDRRRLQLYAEADAATASLATATGLACPPGCGECCARHDPHVTIADVVPLARAAVAAGTAEALLDRALAAPAGPCVYFVPGRLPGGCTVYELRPVLCRLFGFAAVRDKHGRAALAACEVHKAATPEVAARAIAHVAAGGAVAILAEYQARADGLDDPALAEQLPINVALARALERELLRARLAGAST